MSVAQGNLFNACGSIAPAGQSACGCVAEVHAPRAIVAGVGLIRLNAVICIQEQNGMLPITRLHPAVSPSLSPHKTVPDEVSKAWR